MDWLQVVKPNATKLVAYQRKRKLQEEEVEKRRKVFLSSGVTAYTHQLNLQLKARKKAEREYARASAAPAGGMPGGMPAGMGGMPGGVGGMGGMPGGMGMPGGIDPSKVPTL